jgi:hypothetical protein
MIGSNVGCLKNAPTQNDALRREDADDVHYTQRKITAL